MFKVLTMNLEKTYNMIISKIIFLKYFYYFKFKYNYKTLNLKMQFEVKNSKLYKFILN